MNEAGEKVEGPLYVNRRAATVILKKNGESFKWEERTMNMPGEISNVPVIPEKPKDEKINNPEQPKPVAADTVSPGNIDKIRDIIFGNQMQDYEKRFARLEERMFKEMTVSKSESKRNFDSLEQFVNKEIQMLKDRMTEEQNARTESFRELSRQLKDTTRSFEKKIDSLGDQFNDSSSDLRQQIAELSQNLRNEIRQKYNEILSSIERTSQELDTAKIDRASLANFFTEMAMRITND